MVHGDWLHRLASSAPSAPSVPSHTTYVSLTCRSETQSSGDAVKESTEELHDLPGAMKTRTLLDYSTYMTQLIGSESWNPTPSPCHSDKGSPTTHKKVNEQHFYLAFRSSVKAVEVVK